MKRIRWSRGASAAEAKCFSGGRLRTGTGILLLALLLSLMGLAGAAMPELRLCWMVEGQEVSITPVERGGKYFLFLPGPVRAKSPVVRTEPGADLIWNGQTFASGQEMPVELLVGSENEVRFSNGRRLGQVEVMRGSSIPALFFTVDPEEYQRINMGTKFDIRKDARLVMLKGDGSLETAQNIPSMKTHGNSTFFAAKKAFQFKMEEKASLAGMRKNRKWMLLANWFDISLVRNQIAFDLCREIGLSSTPDCAQVDLYINGAYNGVYLLTEKIQLKKGRLEITDLEEILEKLNGAAAYESAPFRKGSGKGIVSLMKWFDLPVEPEDVTGGYLLEIEKALQFSQMTNGAGFVTDGGMCVVVKEPTRAGLREVQYIAGLVNDFHNAVLQKDGYSRATGKYYADYMDMASFARKIIIEEFTGNFDVRAASQYMYKDADSVDGRLYAGPGWDYDLSFGNKDDGLRNPTKLDYVFRRSSDKSYLYHWLLTQQDFVAETRRIFDEEFEPAAEVLLGWREPRPGSPLKTVAEYQEAIRQSAAMNFTRWSARAIPDVWDGSGRTFEDAGNFVANWAQQRLVMMTRDWLRSMPGT